MNSQTDTTTLPDGARLHPVDALANTHNGLVVMTVVIGAACELLEEIEHNPAQAGGKSRKERLSALLNDLATRSENLEVETENQLALSDAEVVAK